MVLYPLRQKCEQSTKNATGYQNDHQFQLTYRNFAFMGQNVCIYQCDKKHILRERPCIIKCRRDKLSHAVWGDICCAVLASGYCVRRVFLSCTFWISLVLTNKHVTGFNFHLSINWKICWIDNLGRMLWRGDVQSILMRAKESLGECTPTVRSPWVFQMRTLWVF